MPLERGRSLLLVGLFCLTACRQESLPEAASGQSAQPPRPFVAFSQPSIVVERVGATVAVPAAVGSTLSQETLASDDPSVVEVTPSGALHALKAGRSTIRSVGDPGQALEVVVRGARELVLIPNPLKLPPRGEGELALLDRTGGGLEDPGTAEWFSSSPEVASVIQGRVTAGVAPGVATITARLGDRIVQATVAVKRPTVAGRSVP